MYFLNIVSRTCAEMIINGLGNANQRNREFVSDVEVHTIFQQLFFSFLPFPCHGKKLINK